jgi:hypothetical protein
VPIPESYYSGVGQGAMRGAIPAEDPVHEHHDVKILRRLPKPLLLVLSVFLLAAEARA